MHSLLNSKVTEYFARVFLTFPFWGSGLSKLTDFPGTIGLMEHFGLIPGEAYAIATIAVQLGGSALIILNRWTWVGAGALGVFTALTIPIVHRFWAIEGEMGVFAFHTAMEHLGMIGAFILVSVLSARGQAARA